MTQGFIDRTSMYGILQTLSYGSPSDCNPWGWRCALEVTSALIGLHHLRLAPAPSEQGPASGPFGALLLSLSDVIGGTEVNAESRTEALKQAKRWAARRQALNGLFDSVASEPGYPDWIDWHITNAWPEHTRRLGALFDQDFIPQIGRALALSDEDLNAVWRLSRDISVVEDFAKRHPDTDEFKLMQAAYVLSILLRGLYHEYLAKGSDMQVFHHPIRHFLSLSGPGQPTSEYLMSRTKWYLSNIVVAASFEETRGARAASWVENVTKARKASLAGAIDLQPKDYDDVALNVAIDSARKADIRIYPHWLENALDAAQALGVGVLTSFVLAGWEGFLATGAAYSLSRQVNLGREVARKIAGGASHFTDLAKAGPGRIERRWIYNDDELSRIVHGNRQGPFSQL